VSSLNKKYYKKIKKKLPEHRKFLQQREGELKDVLKIKDEGYKKFQSKNNVVNIKFAVFKKKGKKLILFIKLKINELKESIRNMENYIDEYEKD
tara:strand:- start:468 stop:749 length:282 start_codon:yes stop_codon:yes gene_type:complete